MIAREKLKAALVEQKIALYLMAPGEDCTEILEGLGSTLALVGMAAELEPKLKRDDPRIKILRGGLSACQQLIRAGGAYDPMQTVAICNGLDKAEELNKTISSASIYKAYICMSKPVLV